MKSRFCVAMLLVFSPVFVFAEDDRINYENLIWGARLPAGYEMRIQEGKDGEKVLSKMLIVTKEGARSHVIVSMETRELPTDGHKRAAAKGYVNGTAKSFLNAGFRITQQELPDVDKAELVKPIDVRLVLKNADNETSYLDMHIILSKFGYNAAVFSTSVEDRKLLWDWANAIAPYQKQ